MTRATFAWYGMVSTDRQTDRRAHPVLEMREHIDSKRNQTEESKRNQLSESWHVPFYGASSLLNVIVLPILPLQLRVTTLSSLQSDVRKRKSNLEKQRRKKSSSFLCVKKKTKKKSRWRRLFKVMNS